jgi:capsular polysaccharide biosynthesis protein
MGFAAAIFDLERFHWLPGVWPMHQFLRRVRRRKQAVHARAVNAVRRRVVRHRLPTRTVAAAQLSFATCSSASELCAAGGGPRLFVAEEPEVMTARPALLERLCWGQGADVEQLFNQSSFVTERHTLMRFDHARLMPRWGLVMPTPGTFLEESLNATRWLAEDPARLPLRPFGFGTLPATFVDHERLFVYERLAQRARRIDGPPGLVLSHWGGDNYGHFWMDCVSGLIPVLDELRSGQLQLLTPPLRPFQREILGLLQIPPRAITEIPDDLVRCDALVFSSLLTCTRTVRPSSRSILPFRLAAGERRASASGLRRLYVTRRGLGGRVLANEAELEARLIEAGFAVVDSGRMSVTRQIDAFSSAEVVVGAIGAGMANVAFSPPGCRVIEILPRIHMDDWLFHLAALAGHSFAYYVAEVEPANIFSMRPVSFQYTVDVDAVVERARAACDLGAGA